MKPNTTKNSADIRKQVPPTPKSDRLSEDKIVAAAVRAVVGAKLDDDSFEDIGDHPGSLDLRL
jgi:hypothetical protein